MGRTEQRRDLTDGPLALRQPSLPIAGAQTPLRACLLSGGASRRMGRDKALLPHHEGGSWLERTLRLLLELNIPVTLLSRHPEHLRLARALACRLAGPANSAQTLPSRPWKASVSPLQCSERSPTPPVDSATPPDRPQPEPSPLGLTVIAEPEPCQGPLLALHRLMEHHPDQRLLLCPVDMPWLTPEVLRRLLQAAEEQPQRIHLAHDGERLQPLVGVYPSPAALRADLSAALQRGERRLQSWLAGQDCRDVRLEAGALRNVNGPEALPMIR